MIVLFNFTNKIKLSIKVGLRSILIGPDRPTIPKSYCNKFALEYNVLLDHVHLSFINRSKDFDIFDFHLFHSQGVLVQNCEVSQLAAFNGSHDVISAHYFSGVLSDGHHSLIRRHLEVLPEAVLICSDSGDSTPRQKKGF